MKPKFRSVLAAIVLSVPVAAGIPSAFSTLAPISPAAAAPRDDRKAEDRVKKAKELYAAQKSYPKGCSGFVCEVLDISWEDANDLMGAAPTYVGVNNQYEGLKPGDIVGWKNPGMSGHVAVYIGESGQKFLDVRDENEKPRKVANGYGSQKLYRSSRF
jgi:hypothetical protein